MATLAEMMGARYGLEPDTNIGSGVAEIPAAVEGLLNRRSIRRYTDATVDDALLDVLLAAAQSAPAKSNLQQYSIIVVSNPAIRARLAALCRETGQMESCPLFLVFCADMRRNRRVCEMRGYSHANDNMDTFLNCVVDAALAMQCFTTAAEAVGLGTACISQVRNRIAEFSDVLELPDGVFPIAGLTAGWPAAPGYVNQRLPASVVVHRDTYDDSNLADSVEDYDQRRHAIFPVPPASQRHTDKYGIAVYCPWSENAARQLSLPERAGFREFLKGHGFALD